MLSKLETRLFIDGKYVAAKKGGTFENLNPATLEKIADVSAGTAEDIDLAVTAAKRCLNSAEWGYKSTGTQRAAILRKLGSIFTERKDELVRLDCLDHGKPKREAEADVGDAITACSHFATLAENQDHEEIVDNGTNGDFITKIVHEPIGVIGAITPWNYPLLMACWKLIPAIAAGCTMVLKPSELAPMSCILLGQLCADAGLPAGAFNVVPGLGPEAGAALASHPHVDKISFTGSCPTAQKIMTCAAATGPRGLTLELGGKSPLIAFPDCDIDATVDWIITGFVWGSGQVCSATSRVLVHSSIRDVVVQKIVERLQTISIGDSLGENWTKAGALMGPVINKFQYDKIWAYIDGAKAQGINLAYGGDRAIVQHLAPGLFIPPTVFTDVPRDARVWVEEIFGPVVCINSFETEEEAITVANDSEYGLAAAVFSADLDRCTRISRELRAGIVWTNNCQPSFIQAPWGGVKKSGFGRELGRWGLEEFTSVKQVTSSAAGYKWGLW